MTIETIPTEVGIQKQGGVIASVAKQSVRIVTLERSEGSQGGGGYIPHPYCCHSRETCPVPCVRERESSLPTVILSVAKNIGAVEW